MDWARMFDTWKSTKTGGLCLWNWMMIKCIMVSHLNNVHASFYCMYFFNIVRHRIIFMFSIKFVLLVKCCEKSSEVWVECDHFEALCIEMHVHTSNLNTGRQPFWKNIFCTRLLQSSEDGYLICFRRLPPTDLCRNPYERSACSP